MSMYVIFIIETKMIFRANKTTNQCWGGVPGVRWWKRSCVFLQKWLLECFL